MRLVIFFLAITLGLVSACTKDNCGSDKDEFLANYNALVQTAGDTKNKPSASEWEKYDEEFRALLQECYQLYGEELTGGQKRAFWGKSIAYYYHRYGSEVLNVVADETNDLSRVIKREIDARWDRPSDAIEEAIMSAAKDWKRIKKNKEVE